MTNFFSKTYTDYESMLLVRAFNRWYGRAGTLLIII